MKVLFAVSNEEISEAIVKKYQRDYKEIISYKNVYYFNAIIKELQKEKDYDRIVISEDLEAFTNTQYDQIDKFIFDKLDRITDEASNMKGDDIPIILICNDRREKSSEMLVKLFGIGIYNALIENDRSVDNVCNLLNKPRLKKDAKTYYKIDTDEVNYQVEDENSVSEIEIQNILAHYRRLGKNESAYVQSFDNIASQYNDMQLRTIISFLPLNVRAVLESNSKKYQQLISYNNKISDDLRRKYQEEKPNNKTTNEKLLKMKNNNINLSQPVIIPEEKDDDDIKKIVTGARKIDTLNSNYVDNDEKSDVEEEPKVVSPKKGRGRPRKYPIIEENDEDKPKRGRGRPRKEPIIEDYNDEEEYVPPMNFHNNIEEDKEEEAPILFEEEEKEIENPTLPKFEENENNKEPEEAPVLYQPYEEETINNEDDNEENYENQKDSYEDIDISNLLTSDRKVACFIGTSKNGTSFIVNNLAQITSSMGINTAILDTTKNRNSYYIYTKNEEELRKIALHSITNLCNGVADGIKVKDNLTVYTSLPDETEGIENVGEILKTLLENYSLVLVDCDYDTPVKYFDKAQEIYLVQSYDILTIQPLTAFLRDLKAKNILKEGKLRIVLNKAMKLRGVSDRTIIGGMANYNDPAMSFMTELFNQNSIKYVIVPFDQETYGRYLEGVINCEMSVRGYPKNMIQTFNELARMLYPSAIPQKVTKASKMSYTPPQVQKSAFTPSMNSTLDQMRNNRF